jgi:L-threonylcarbamoyladenylate synthase
MLLEVCDNVVIDPAILHEVEEGATVASPGMKYKHYSPKADIIMVESDFESFKSVVDKAYSDGVYTLVFDGDEANCPYRHMSYGSDSLQQAHLLFQRLRELDELGAKKVYVRAPSPEGIGLAVYNRLIRAAGFEVIRI